MKIGSARIAKRSSPRATASQRLEADVMAKMCAEIMEPVCRASCLFEFAYIQQLLPRRVSLWQKMDHVPPAPGETAISLMDC
jgi:hypothetical protein